MVLPAGTHGQRRDRWQSAACIGANQRGRFQFFAGMPDENLIQGANTPILGPRTENWEPVIEKVLGG